MRPARIYHKKLFTRITLRVTMTQLVKKFGKIQSVLNTPHLLELQIQSYHHFLQKDIATAARADVGLEGVFRSVFPIHDFNKTATLEFVSYEIGQPKFDVPECLAKGLHHEAPSAFASGLWSLTWMRKRGTGPSGTSKSRTSISGLFH